MTPALTSRPGHLMATEIGEQPAIWRSLLAHGDEAGIDAAAEMIRARRPRAVLFVARGTSDHAALYAAYLTEIRLGLPAGLASPSAITVFGASGGCGAMYWICAMASRYPVMAAMGLP